MLAGYKGGAAAFAMRLITEVGEAQGASCLIDITRAHVSSVYDNGPPSLDFAELMVATGAWVRVPTTLTAGSIDFVHPDLRAGSEDEQLTARLLINLHQQMGCTVTMTCAPYLVETPPALGEHVAWSGSSAVVLANSVFGARTERYVEFLDLCAALTGRVPDVGLHTDEGRRGTLLVHLNELPQSLFEQDAFYQVLGYWLGSNIGSAIPVLEGLPKTVSEDQLRALGAAAATSGTVAMFHVVGVTPEAGSLGEAFGGDQPDATQFVSLEDLAAARSLLSTPFDRHLSAVCLGSPHFSLAEFEQLLRLINGRRVDPEVNFYVTTSRHTIGQLDERDWTDTLKEAGVRLVADTCTYFGPVLDGCDGAVMTSSAKWAHYAPGNLGAQVVFGSLPECVDSAVAGEVRHNTRLWGEASES